jgi:hypothetical protein
MQILKDSLLVILGVFYFIVFHYANNVSIVNLSSSISIILLMVGLALIIYLIYYGLFQNRRYVAALASFLFIIFFLTYGLIYDWLVVIDVITIKHYSLLPLIILLGFSISLFVSLLKQKQVSQIQKIVSIVIFCLIVYNLFRIVPVEIHKANLHKRTQNESGEMLDSPINLQKYPDIYYIILDEAAGFDVIKNYFNYDKIDDFTKSLKEKGFFIAEESRTYSTNTYVVMAERFNYKRYTDGNGELFYFEEIVNNQTMKYLKDKGYTIGVLNQMGGPLAYSYMPSFDVDFSLEIDESMKAEISSFSDGFVDFVIRPTMLRPFFEEINFSRPVFENHASQIYYVMEKIGDLNEVDSPSFVYVHLLLPHYPFMFAEDGSINDNKNFKDWSYYLGNYIFSMNVANVMISNILERAPKNNPPVIIFQSDHGARNGGEKDPDRVTLSNYPDDYRHHIINAILLPNCEHAPLSQDMDPINTFPIIFNCLFNDNIPLE